MDRSQQLPPMYPIQRISNAVDEDLVVWDERISNVSGGLTPVHPEAPDLLRSSPYHSADLAYCDASRFNRTMSSHFQGSNGSLHRQNVQNIEMNGDRVTQRHQTWQAPTNRVGMQTDQVGPAMVYRLPQDVLTMSHSTDTDPLVGEDTAVLPSQTRYANDAPTSTQDGVSTPDRPTAVCPLQPTNVSRSMTGRGGPLTGTNRSRSTGQIRQVRSPALGATGTPACGQLPVASRGGTLAPSQLSSQGDNGSKIPHVDWHDDLVPSLTDELLDVIMTDASLRRILYPGSGDKRSSRPAKFGHTILAKELFGQHEFYGKFYSQSPTAYEEAVRSKLKFLKRKYQECRGKLSATGAGLQEEDYEAGNSTLWSMIRDHLRQYDIMHELLGERASIGKDAVNSKSPVNGLGARLPQRSTPAPKRARKMGQHESDSENSEHSGDLDESEDRMGDLESEAGEIDNLGNNHPMLSSFLETKGSKRVGKGNSKHKGVRKEKDSQLDFRSTSVQASRLEPLGKALQESAKLKTERLASKDARLMTLQEKAQMFAEKVAERKLKLKEERFQHEAEASQLQTNLRKEELELENAKIKLENHRLEVEANRIKLEGARIQLELFQAENERMRLDSHYSGNK